MSAASTAWIVSPRYDLFWFFGGAVLSLLALSLYFGVGIPIVVLWWVWLLAFDGPHIGAAVTRLMSGDTEDRGPLGTLTPRERDITRLVGEGLKNDAIAQRLFISEKTVRNHLTVIFDKVGVRDRLHLAIYAYRRGLAKLPF